MPYEIREADGKFEVIVKGSGKVVGTHPSKDKAEAQMAALYANVPEAKDDGKSADIKSSDKPGDYLIVEDPQKPTTWHLQVRKDGKIDHGLLGAAWAALHEGFRGNAYEGPGKQEAISKLKKLYEEEKMPVPGSKALPPLTLLDLSMKIGQRNNASDQKRIQEMHDIAKRLHDLACENGAECNCEDMGDMPAPAKAEPPKKVESIDSAPGGKRWAIVPNATVTNCETPEVDVKAEAIAPEVKAEKPEPAAPEKPAAKLAVPFFNYVSHLRLPYEEQYLKDTIAVKSVARDTIRGYSMLWGSPELTDVETEFFTAQSDFWDKQLEGVSRPLTWDHAQDPKTKSNPLIGSIEAFGDDDIGRWYVAQLNRNHMYRKAIDALISKREVGTSSDSASQYVVRVPQGKAVWLKQWPWFASALTPTPAEPRMLDVGLPFWKSVGIDFGRMAGPDGLLKIPDALRMQAELLKARISVP